MKKVTDEQLIDAIKKNAGIVSDILTTLKKEYGIEVTRDAIYKRKETNAAIAAAFEEAEDNILDIAESYLIKAINKGEMKPIMFYLRTKGKRRGYTERQEITGANEKPIEVDPFANWTTEQLKEALGFTPTTNKFINKQHVCSVPAEK